MADQIIRNEAGNFEIAPATLKSICKALECVADGIVSLDWLADQPAETNAMAGLMFSVSSVTKRQDAALASIQEIVGYSNQLDGEEGLEFKA